MTASFWVQSVGGSDPTEVLVCRLGDPGWRGGRGISCAIPQRKRHDASVSQCLCPKLRPGLLEGACGAAGAGWYVRAGGVARGCEGGAEWPKVLGL